MQNIIAILNGIFIGSGSGGGGGLFPGILDAYPDAAAAYSLRRLSNDWAKPANTDFTFGNALEFDGTNNYVNVGTNLNPALANNFGFSCWFKTTSTTTVSNRVADPFVGFASNQWASAVGLNGGKITTMSFDGAVQQNEGSNTFNDGQWHCMTMLRTRGATDLLAEASIWIDGVLELDAVSFNIIPEGYRWADLGASRPTEYADIILDEMVFYQSVGLSVGLAENVSYYNSGKGALATDVFTDIYAYYKMNESGGATTAIDSSGNGNDGTLVNFPPFAWQAGGGLNFDGVNDYVTYSQLSITGKGVISFWYNDATTSQVEIFNLASNPSYFIGVVASLNSIYYKAGSGVYTFNFSGGITAGIWNHILISIDVSAVTVNAWINGVQSDNVDLTSSRPFLSDRWNLREGGYDDFTLDETGIKLGVTGTTANALALYNGGAGASFDTVFPSPNRHYKLNETAGTVAADSGSDGANGTLVDFNTTSSWVEGNANKGVLVEIRRSSDDTVKAFYYDDNNELSLTSEDAAGTTLSSWIGSDNGFVSTWYDQSGNANNAVQETFVQQPQIITSGSLLLLNNMPVLDMGFGESKLLLPSFAAAAPSIFAVSAFTGTGATGEAGTIISGGDTTSDRFDFGSVSASNYRFFISESGSVTQISSSVNYFNSNQYLFSANPTQLRTDGVTVASGTISTEIIAGTDDFRVGERYFGSGNANSYIKMQELIFYTSDKSTNQSGIETNINDFYSIYNTNFIRATGGTITTIGDYKVHTFTGSTGTFTVTSLGTDPTYGDTVEYLVVAGGGGGGTLLGSGAGAGGLLTDTLATVSSTSYAVTIGAGGAGATVTRTRGASGNNSTFYGVTAIGGGGGGANSVGNRDGGAGGSGGGGTYSGLAGTGTVGQGNDGGVGREPTPINQAGGGGAGGVGGSGTSTPNAAGDGGVGLSNSITGSAVFYAGGGGGSAYVTDSGTAGNGGLGGGGDGGIVAGSDADANTGGGGGGSDRDVSGTPAGGNGGSGIVIVRYKFQ